MAIEVINSSVEHALEQLVSADRQVADDLILVLRAFIAAESRHIAIDDVVGHCVDDRVRRLARLELVLAHLELEVGL